MTIIVKVLLLFAKQNTYYLPMECSALLNAWNASFGERLHLSTEVLDYSFFRFPQNSREILQGEKYCVLLKKSPTTLRVHLILMAEPEKPEKYCSEIFSKISDLGKSLGVKQIVFGGGDHHLFPGVPKVSGHKSFFEFFSPTGPEVVDFEGKLDHLAKLSSSLICQGTVSSPKTPKEKDELIQFVAREFNGRWEREIAEDFKLGFEENYWGYYLDNRLAGYMRCYGWKSNYWGPAVYFSGPGKGTGGVGPIGVDSQLRGQGIGMQLLKSAWDILLKQKCKFVRIDWTTETKFYEKAGLKIVQRYQPAAHLL